MKIFLASDVHLEFYRNHHAFIDSLDPDGIDVAILAGDIFAFDKNSVNFLKDICDMYPHVLHVMGNHEAYQTDFDFVQENLRAAEKEIKNYHFLDMNHVTIQEQRFIGCTLWYDKEARGNRNMYSMNDFHIIDKKEGFQNFIFDYAEKEKAYLKENVQKDDVVITHMLPSPSCVDNTYRSSDMNVFYYNDCDDIINENRPKLWVHGHSHNFYDKVLGDTRVVRNPKGYPHEYLPFKKNFVIEI